MGRYPDTMRFDLCIIGGAGHVGLPLGVAFANAGVRTVLFDADEPALERVRSGEFPFREEHGGRELKRALARRMLGTATSPQVIAKSAAVLLVIGTPVDPYLNPDIHGITAVIEDYLPHFRNGQVLILRSTVYPGTSERIQRFFRERKKRIGVAFCPERIVQGQALREIRMLPQIVSAFDPKTLRRVSRLFQRITENRIVEATPIEAELSKLFSNAWRYIKFAAANQFYMIAADQGLDYHRIHRAMTEGYPRNADLPGPGFSAGPCLLKDTMQLSAFHSNNFFLGHAAMLINEGLPDFVVKKLRHGWGDARFDPELIAPPVARAASMGMTGFLRRAAGRDLKTQTVGILGMAFKGDSDDPRDSLAYKLRKVAQAEAKRVLCHDVYIKDPSFVPLQTVLHESDVIILAAPHREYATIDPRRYRGKKFVDIWNFWPKRRVTSALA